MHWFLIVPCIHVVFAQLEFHENKNLGTFHLLGTFQESKLASSTAVGPSQVPWEEILDGILVLSLFLAPARLTVSHHPAVHGAGALGLCCTSAAGRVRTHSSHSLMEHRKLHQETAACRVSVHGGPTSHIKEVYLHCWGNRKPQAE